MGLHGWRNCESTTIDVDGPVVVLHGDNAQGKTNVLEAVHVLANLKSFREPRPRRWLAEGSHEARLHGVTETDQGRRTIVWKWADGVRTLNVDDVDTHDLETWFSCLRAVVFCPEDGAIVRGEPERRRRFLDRAAFTANPAHLTAVQQYRRIVRHKGALLRSGLADPMQLDVWDEQLAPAAAAVIQRRRSVLSELRPRFAELYANIAGAESVELKMRCTGFDSLDDLEDGEIENVIREAIARRRPEEIERGQVLVGPHRDDLQIQIEHRLARNFASQGQARSLVLALKLAELRAAEIRGQSPMFLLDDLTSELDAGRRARLLSIVETLPGQVWITTTDKAYLGTSGLDTRLHFRVESGRVFPGE